jgi:hypothetical protein
MPKQTDCILWPGAVDKDGYGRVKLGGRMQRAHRVALAKKLGRELTPRELALHTCHHRHCVNPEHLEAGSITENNRAARSRQVTLAKSILGVELEVVRSRAKEE